MPDTRQPSEPDLDAMRERLRVRLAEQSRAFDGSRAFQCARLAGRLPPAALAAAALLLVASLGYIAQQQISHSAKWSSAPLEADALPIRALTPGATARVSADDLCAGRGPSKEEIAPAVRLAVLHDYRMDGLPETDYELDYLITPELGGSSDRRNLWPERYSSRVWNARVKDELERLLPSLVCRGAVDLTTAQRDIAADWIAAYKKYFHTDRPVETQARLVIGE